jgi:hypothetical protein
MARRDCAGVVEVMEADGAVPHASAVKATTEARRAMRGVRVFKGLLRARVDATAAEALQDR